MADESELRVRFRDEAGDPTASDIDLDAVLRRARARRGRRAALATAGGLLAASALIVPVVTLTLTATPPTALVATDDGRSEAADSATGSAEAAPTGADGLWRCGAPAPDLPEPEPHAATGLNLRVDPVTADAGATAVELRVVLRNDGADPVTAVTPHAPQVALVDDTSVVWHSPAGSSSRVTLHLAPGDEAEYTARFDAVVCEPEDDVTGFRPDLPAAGPGSYRLLTALDVTLEDGTVALLIAPAEAVIR